MAAAQSYASTVRRAHTDISVANPNRDGTGTITNVMTAGASGSRIDAIIIQAAGTTTAGMVRLFEYDGTNSRLIGEVPVQAVVPGASTVAFSARLTTANQADLLPIILPSGWALRASTHNAETFNVSAAGGDF